MPEQDGEERLRALWSGVITFGLVNIAVDLHSATRPRSLRLRMLAPDGTPLERRYYCPDHERFVDSEEIVRGHQSSDETFVTVGEEELAALEPKRSREIDLKLFVPRDQLSPLHLHRTYVLVPGGETNKAYRLLAATLARSGRAGIATFVMRGHSYLVAITSDEGLLRAQLLRYADETRAAEDLDIPAPKKAEPKRVKALVEAIEASSADALDPKLLEDDEGEALLRLAHAKAEEGEVVEIARETSTSGEGRVIDLMQLLEERLLAEGKPKSARPRRGSEDRASHTRRRRPASPRRAKSKDKLEGQTKEELYEQAKRLEIPGRSQMSKAELARAVAESA